MDLSTGKEKIERGEGEELGQISEIAKNPHPVRDVRSVGMEASVGMRHYQSSIILKICFSSNIIEIVTEDGEKMIKNIWCENDIDYRQLKSLGRFLEEKGIDVKMKGFW